MLLRLKRRSTAYSLVGTQLLNGYLAAKADATRMSAQDHQDEAFALPTSTGPNAVRAELLVRNMPSVRKVVGSNIDRWSMRFSLNKTGKSADTEQMVKDLVRRAYLQSRPVLHMAHSLNYIMTEIGPKLDGWGDWDWLLVLLWNPDVWIWKAIDIAETWRCQSCSHMTLDLSPDQMIVLISPKSAG